MYFSSYNMHMDPDRQAAKDITSGVDIYSWLPRKTNGSS